MAIAFAGLGLLVVLLEKDVPLRQELDTEYGLDEKGKSENAKDAEAGVDTSLVVGKKE